MVIVSPDVLIDLGIDILFGGNVTTALEPFP